MAEGAQLRAREQAAIKNRGVVRSIDNHRVGGAQKRPERPQIGLMAGREHDRVLGLHPFGELALELEVQGDRAVEQPRAREPGSVSVKCRLGARQHALIPGQSEVVVGAEHDPLCSLHLDHRHRRRVEQVEVGQHVRLARRRQNLGALVSAHLLEDVG